MDKTLHVQVKHLPRLHYMLILTKDYRHRALEELMPMKIPIPAENSQLTPELISQGKIDLRYEEVKRNLKLEKCKGRESEDDILKPKRSRKENCSWKMCIHLRSDDQTIDHILSPEHADDITEYLEKDIYRYVKSVNEELERHICVGTSHLPKIILTGQAILNENPNREKEHVDEYWQHERVSRLKSVPGVVGYGMEKGGVFVLAKCTTGMKRKDLQKEIIGKLGKESNMIWIEKDLQEYSHHAGMQLIPETSLHRYTSTGGQNGYGSLGVFGKTETGTVVATTAGHLFESEGEQVFIVNNGAAEDEPYEMIGTCMSRLYDHPTDFALVKMEDTVAQNYKNTIWFPKLNAHLKIVLYKREPGELNGKTVHTLQTEFNSENVMYSDGIVKSDLFHFSAFPDKHGYITITNKDKRRPFASPGHSGAPVIKIEFENGLPVAQVVATLTHGPSADTNDDLFISWRMDESLKEIEEEKGIIVNIDTTTTE